MWIPNSSRCVLEWKLDSGLGIPDSLSVEIGFHIPIVTGITDSWVEFRIPKPRISDSTNKDFPDSGIWITLPRLLFPPTTRGLSNDDGDGNENGKKATGLDRQNNNFARTSRVFLHFFAVAARLQRESA